MTQRVTDEQARTCFQVGSMPMRQQQVTQFALDLAADLLDARAEIELLKGEVKHAETRSGMANVVAQFEAQLKVERAEVAALKSKLEDIEDAHGVVMDERCGADEVHCTCVPALRYEVAALKAKLAAVCEAGEAFISRVDILSKKIDSAALIAEMHGCNPFGKDDNWCKEHEALNAAISAIRAAAGEGKP